LNLDGAQGSKNGLARRSLAISGYGTAMKIGGFSVLESHFIRIAALGMGIGFSGPSFG
jgi:hypothetical protein